MSHPIATVLVVDDEAPIRRFLEPAIKAAGWRLVEAGTAAQAILEATQSRPDAIILDLGLPDQHGVEVIRRVREWSKIPIIVLSAHGQEKDKVSALDAGADDYVQKPFGVNELMARVRAAMRRSEGNTNPAAQAMIKAADVTIDLSRRIVTRKGQEVHLTPIEYKLLATLAKNAGLVMTHRQLLREVWGPGHAEESHYLRIFMSQLRKKLENNPANPEFLISETGIGYRFKTEG